jgi:hypothetical protein
MKTAQNLSIQHRLIGRFALIALFATVFASAASAFSVSFNTYPGGPFKLFGQAHFESNSLCPGGYMIDQIGFGAANYATLNVTVPAAGVYNVSVQLETLYPRNLYISIGGEASAPGPTTVSKFPVLTTGKSFKIPVEWSFGTITLPAGTSTFYFFNATSGNFDRCPYISQVTISQ